MCVVQECFSQLTHLVPMVIDSDPKAANAMSRKTKAAVLSQSKYCLTGGREEAISVLIMIACL